MSRRQNILIMGYINAGTDFIADRIRDVFSEIRTTEDMALHNACLKEIVTVIGPEKGPILRERVADVILSLAKYQQLQEQQKDGQRKTGTTVQAGN